MRGFIELRRVSSSKLQSFSSYSSFISSTVQHISFIATPQASLRRRESISRQRAASISLSRLSSPLSLSFSTSQASGYSMICLRLWLLRIGTTIFTGYFSLWLSRQLTTTSKHSPSTSFSRMVPSLEFSAKVFAFWEWRVKRSSLILNSVPSEVRTLRTVFVTFSGGGGGGGC